MSNLNASLTDMKQAVADVVLRNYQLREDAVGDRNLTDEKVQEVYAKLA